MRALVLIELETKDDMPDGWGELDAFDEALFNLGIGEPDENGEQWPNMEGMAFKVNAFTIKVDLPPCFVLKE